MTTEFLGYPVPVEYSAGLEVDSTWFTVTYDGSTYVAVTDAVPFTTASDFNAAQWQAIEGVTATDFSESGGASMIGLPNLGTVADAIRYYTPEMYGAVGDGSTDDYAAFQKMLDEVPSRGTIWLDSSKTYYNAFGDGGGSGKTWIRNKPITILCNGALMERATPTSNDGQSAVLKLTGEGPFYINDLRINGNNPIGQPWNNDGTQNEDGYEIALCEAIDYGIYALSATQVYITGAEIYNCAFNIWAKSVTDLRLTGYLHHSGQVVPNIVSGGDLALGAGIKLSDCTHFDIDVRGYHNTNATVEVEPTNIYGKVRQISTENISNGLVLYDSACIDFISITDGTDSGCGTNISRGAHAIDMRNITGTVISRNCADTGLRIYLDAGAAGDISQLNIRAQCYACGNQGADIRNVGGTYKIDNLYLEYDGLDNASATVGNDLWVQGDVRGRIVGRSKGCYNGLICNGTNYQATALMISMDLSETASVAYSIGSSFYADLVGTRTSTEYKLTSSVQNMRLARSMPSGATQPYSDIVLNASYLYAPNLPASATYTSQFYYEGSTATVKIKVS